MSDDEDGSWIDVQKKAFTKWSNTYLRKRKMEVSRLPGRSWGPLF
jgi:hypothetical protein